MTRLLENRTGAKRKWFLAAAAVLGALACTTAGVSDPVGVEGVRTMPAPPEAGRECPGALSGKWKYVRMESKGSNAQASGSMTYSQVLTLSIEGDYVSSNTWMFGKTGKWYCVGETLYFEPNLEKQQTQKSVYGNPYRIAADGASLAWGPLTLTREKQ